MLLFFKGVTQPASVAAACSQSFDSFPSMATHSDIYPNSQSSPGEKLLIFKITFWPWLGSLVG